MKNLNKARSESDLRLLIASSIEITSSFTNTNTNTVFNLHFCKERKLAEWRSMPELRDCTDAISNAQQSPSYANSIGFFSEESITPSTTTKATNKQHTIQIEQFKNPEASSFLSEIYDDDERDFDFHNFGFCGVPGDSEESSNGGDRASAGEPYKGNRDDGELYGEDSYEHLLDEDPFPTFTEIASQEIKWRKNLRKMKLLDFLNETRDPLERIRKMKEIAQRIGEEIEVTRIRFHGDDGESGEEKTRVPSDYDSWASDCCYCDSMATDEDSYCEGFVSDLDESILTSMLDSYGKGHSDEKADTRTVGDKDCDCPRDDGILASPSINSTEYGGEESNEFQSLFFKKHGDLIVAESQSNPNDEKPSRRLSGSSMVNLGDHEYSQRDDDDGDVDDEVSMGGVLEELDEIARDRDVLDNEIDTTGDGERLVRETDGNSFDEKKECIKGSDVCGGEDDQRQGTDVVADMRISRNSRDGRRRRKKFYPRYKITEHDGLRMRMVRIDPKIVCGGDDVDHGSMKIKLLITG